MTCVADTEEGSSAGMIPELGCLESDHAALRVFHQRVESDVQVLRHVFQLCRCPKRTEQPFGQHGIHQCLTTVAVRHVSGTSSRTFSNPTMKKKTFMLTENLREFLNLTFVSRTANSNISDTSVKMCKPAKTGSVC